MKTLDSRHAYTVTRPGADALTETDRREYWAAYTDTHFLNGRHAYEQQPYAVHLVRQQTPLYTLHTAWQEGRTALQHTPRHVRQGSKGDYHLLMCLAGEPLIARRGRDEATLAPGTAALLNEEVSCDVRLGAYSGVALKIPWGEISGRVGGAPLDLAFEFHRGLGKLIREMMRNLYEERDHITQRQFDDICGHIVELLCTLVVGDQSPPSGVRADVLLAQVRQYIRAHAGDPSLSLPRVAAALGYSQRRLQQAMGGGSTSYREVLKEERLARAQRMLSAGSDRPPPVSEIAAQCGFTSAAAFGRSFQMRYGESPREYLYRSRGTYADSGPPLLRG